MRELERQQPRRAGLSAPPPITVIGQGRVGRALTRALDGAGYEVELAGREGLAAAAERAEVAILAVPDGAIAAVCEAVASVADPPRMIGHCSGATGLDALDAALGVGASAFSIHPLQAISASAQGDPLLGAPCAVSGSDPATLELASLLAQRIGMRPFRFDESARAAYHAAASIASNFLVALEESACELLTAAGVAGGREARELLAPLVLQSAATWAEQGRAGLTGPIARGDEATVARHIAAIDQTAPQLAELYTALARRTRAIAAAGPTNPGDSSERPILPALGEAITA